MMKFPLSVLMPRAWPRLPLGKPKETSTSLEDAKCIMGTRMHALEDIRGVYRLSKDDTENLERRVPFTRKQLEWAREHGIVLTPHIFSARHMAASFPNDIFIADEVRRGCAQELSKVPRNSWWHLVMRPTHHDDEERALLTRPKNLVFSNEPAALSVFLAMAYADLKINGIPLFTCISDRYVLPVITTTTGVLLRRVIVRGNIPQSGKPSICVMTCQAHAPYRPAYAWGPQRIA